MSWRVVNISSNAKLDYKMNYLVVRTQFDTKRISITEISTLVIESTAVSLTSYLISELVKNKINIILCDEKRLPQSVISPLYGSFDTSLKIRTQIAWDSTIKGLVWAEIVRQKIIGQKEVLNQLERDNADLLSEYCTQIEVGDVTNREGHAAKVYFNSLFGKDFSRASDNVINAALNYGYSIILSAVAREIAVLGYANQLGIFHNNVHNALNFACDLMEVFRPFVDFEVCQMELVELEHEEKLQLVNILNKKVRIDEQQQYMTQAIRTYVRSVTDSLMENDISLIKNPTYEL